MQLGLVGGRAELKQRSSSRAYSEWTQFLREINAGVPDSIEIVLARMASMISGALGNKKAKAEDFWPPIGDPRPVHRDRVRDPRDITDAQHAEVAKSFRERMKKMAGGK